MATVALYPHIAKEPGICGGQASIDATRVRVMDVVWLHKQGRSPERILEVYPHLNLGQVHAALGYYYDHLQEIEESFREEDLSEAAFEARRAELMRRRAAG